MDPRARSAIRPHCFRRGATQEMQLAGNPEHRIKAAGCWAEMGFRSYIDTQMTGALKITRLLVSSLTNSDSDDDWEFPLLTSRADTLRKKLLNFPGSELPR